MKPMVVLFALASVACGSWLPLAQPPHHPALVLDPHGRPLDTAEVINARALHLQAKALEHHAPLTHSIVAPAVVAHALPAAVSHQSRVDVHSSPAIVAHAPLVAAHSAPLLSYSAHSLAGHGHWLKKRSLGHYALAAPIIAHAPAATSHQSRVDVISSPAVVSHAVHAAPVLAHAAPVVAHAIAPSAVSHQSRVDVRSSPAILSHAAYAPLAHSVVAAPLAHSGLLHSAPLYTSSHLAHSSPLVHAW